MLAEERIQKIKEFVDANGSATVNELMDLLKASESTIRRDLADMDKNHLISRVHGGAVSHSTVTAQFVTMDETIERRRGINTEQKKSIARYAASLVNDGDSVYIDTGSTTEFLAEYLEASGATYVTNSFAVARILGAKNYKVYLIGGEFKPTTEAIVGEIASLALEHYNFTKGFFGTNGVDLKRGLTTPEIKEGFTKGQALLRSRDKYILTDKSKFDVISSYAFGNLDDTIIITTGDIPKKYEEDNTVTIIKV